MITIKQRTPNGTISVIKRRIEWATTIWEYEIRFRLLNVSQIKWIECVFLFIYCYCCWLWSWNEAREQRERKKKRRVWLVILNIEQIISQDEVRALYSFDIYILLKIESIQLAHSCETVAAAISSVSIEFSSSAQSRHQREATTSNSTKIHFNHTFSRERDNVQNFVAMHFRYVHWDEYIFFSRANVLLLVCCNEEAWGRFGGEYSVAVGFENDVQMIWNLCVCVCECVMRV